VFTERKSQELNLETVCHGPALSGNTPGLGYAHNSIVPRLRVEPIFLQTREDRTLFFPSLPPEAGSSRASILCSASSPTAGQVVCATARLPVFEDAEAGASRGIPRSMGSRAEWRSE
jgi:hypothetical protein